MTTITTILWWDNITDSREVINTNDTNLNNDKVETSVTINWNALTSNIVLDADDIWDWTTNKAYTATEKTKLAWIEATADVTDTTNVTAAWALMDSELTSIADVKALDQSVVSWASPVFATTNMTEWTNKNFVTDAEATVIWNTSNTNTWDQDLSWLALKSNVLELDNTDSFTPDADYEPATKKYVDDNAWWTPEWTAVLSTWEVWGTKYLREDWDGTCSWQTPAWSWDMLLWTVQTVTAEKIYDKDKISMLWTSTWKNIVSVANTSATDYTNTFPAKTWTIAMTSDITGTNSGTNTWDQTSIVWITWTKAEFDTAVTDWNIVYTWDDITWKSASTDALNSATTTVDVSSATAPTNWQILTATSSTTATWQSQAWWWDVSKVGTPVDNQIWVWTWDGTIEWTSGLTYDGSDFHITGWADLDWAVTINETWADVDFRVESNVNANTFFVRGSDWHIWFNNSNPKAAFTIWDAAAMFTLWTWAAQSFWAARNIYTDDWGATFKRLVADNDSSALWFADDWWFDFYSNSDGNSAIDSTITLQHNMRISKAGNVWVWTATPSVNADLTLEWWALCIKETTTPTADTNYGKIYTKTDNLLYFQDGAWSEHEVPLSGWWWSNAPLFNVNIDWEQIVQELYTFVCNWAITAWTFRASLWTKPTWADFIIKLYKNTTEDGSITIATGASATNWLYQWTDTSFVSGSYAAWDVVTVEVTQIGSTVAGSWLTFSLFE